MSFEKICTHQTLVEIGITQYDPLPPPPSRDDNVDVPSLANRNNAIADGGE